MEIKAAAKWSNPRATIANIYKDNDMAYTLHGTMCAYEILRTIDKKPSDLKDCTILDYGCGTGKNTRAIHYFFKNSIGFDPVKECIIEAHKEYTNINKEVNGFPNKIDLCRPGRLSFTNNLNNIIDVEFDYVFANNVIEHLDYANSKVAIDNMLKMCKTGGSVIFNTFKDRSKKIIDEYKAKNSLVITEQFGYYMIKK